MRSVCPSFAFGTHSAQGSVSFGPSQGMVRNPNIPLKGVSYSPLDSIGVLHTFEGGVLQDGN